MKRCIALIFVMLGLVALSQSVTRTNVPTPPLTFGWGLSPDPTVDSYRLWQGGISKFDSNFFGYSNFVWAPNTNGATWNGNFQRGVPLYFNITAAVSTNGLESDYDGEVVWQFAALPPTVTGVVATSN